MNLVEAITAYGHENFDDKNEWYQWHRINPKHLPSGISLPSGNAFVQNISLRKQLSTSYRNGEIDVRQALINYYISVSGSVKRRRAQNLQNYSQDEPKTLIAKGIKGIASWSTALTLREPDRYSIYDARVALSLNLLQITKAVENPLFFPLLRGQNKAVDLGCQEVVRFATQHGCRSALRTNFYEDYNNTLHHVSKRLKVESHMIEMLLFAKPILLLETLYDREQW